MLVQSKADEDPVFVELSSAEVKVPSTAPPHLPRTFTPRGTSTSPLDNDHISPGPRILPGT